MHGVLCIRACVHVYEKAVCMRACVYACAYAVGMAVVYLCMCELVGGWEAGCTRVYV